MKKGFSFEFANKEIIVDLELFQRVIEPARFKWVENRMGDEKMEIPKDNFYFPCEGSKEIRY